MWGRDDSKMCIRDSTAAVRDPGLLRIRVGAGVPDRGRCAGCDQHAGTAGQAQMCIRDRIRDVVLSKSSVTAQNITVVEVK